MKRYKLSDIANIGSSKRIHLSDYVSEGVPFYRSREVIQLSKGEMIKDPLYISKEKYDEIKSKFPVPEVNDILITSVGTLGIPYLVKDANFYFKDGNLTWLRDIDTEIVDVHFLYIWLQSAAFENQIRNNNIGAVQKAITIDYLNDVNIDLPDMSTQKSVASIISAIDDKIRINVTCNMTLSAAAKDLYTYWFSQFDFPDKDGNPYKSSGGKMTYNDKVKHKIPNNWTAQKLEELTNIYLGGTPATDNQSFWQNGTVPWLNSSEVANFPVVTSELKITEDAVNSSAAKVMKAGTVLLSIVRYIRPTILAIDAAANQSVVGVEETSEFKRSFLYQYLESQISRYMTQRTGAQQPHINKEAVSSSYIVVPDDKSILEQYYQIAEPLYELIINRAKENQTLNELRNWLLPLLMNGQVIVNTKVAAI